MVTQERVLLAPGLAGDKTRGVIDDLQDPGIAGKKEGVGERDPAPALARRRDRTAC